MSGRPPARVSRSARAGFKRSGGANKGATDNKLLDLLGIVRVRRGPRGEEELLVVEPDGFFRSYHQDVMQAIKVAVERHPPIQYYGEPLSAREQLRLGSGKLSLGKAVVQQDTLGQKYHEGSLPVEMRASRMEQAARSHQEEDERSAGSQSSSDAQDSLSNDSPSTTAQPHTPPVHLHGSFSHEAEVDEALVAAEERPATDPAGQWCYVAPGHGCAPSRTAAEMPRCHPVPLTAYNAFEAPPPNTTSYVNERHMSGPGHVMVPSGLHLAPAGHPPPGMVPPSHVTWYAEPSHAHPPPGGACGEAPMMSPSTTVYCTAPPSYQAVYQTSASSRSSWSAPAAAHSAYFPPTGNLPTGSHLVCMPSHPGACVAPGSQVTQYVRIGAPYAQAQPPMAPRALETVPMRQAVTCAATPYQVVAQPGAVHEQAQGKLQSMSMAAAAPTPYPSHGIGVREVALAPRPYPGQGDGQDGHAPKTEQEKNWVPSLNPFSASQAGGKPCTTAPATLPGGVGQGAVVPKVTSQESNRGQQPSQWQEHRWVARRATSKSADSSSRRNGLIWKNAEIL